MPTPGARADPYSTGAAGRSPSRFVLIGEGALLIACGERLLARGHSVVGVVAREAGVLVWARDRDVATCPPNETLPAFMAACSCDDVLSIYNFALLPEAVLAAPRRRAINFHDGPLPDFAGFHATSWALLEGRTSHAVTWHVMTMEPDGGPIVLDAAVPIAADETAFTLNVKCFEAGLASFDRLLDRIETGSLALRAQATDGRRFHPRSLRPAAGGVLSWSLPAQSLAAAARAMDFGPAPNPFMTPKLLLGLAPSGSDEPAFAVPRQIAVEPGATAAAPGTILAAADRTLTVATADGAITLAELTTLSGDPVALAGRLQPGDMLPALPEPIASALADWFADASRAEAHWLAVLRRRSAVAGAATGAGRDPFEPVNPAECRTLRFGMAGRLPRVAALMGGADSPGDAGLALWAALAALDQGDGWSLGLCSPRVAVADGLIAHLIAPVVPLELAVDEADDAATFAARCGTCLAALAERSPYARDLRLRYPDLAQSPPQRHYAAILDRPARLDAYEPPLVGPVLLAIPDAGDDGLFAYDSSCIDETGLRRLADRFTAFVDAVIAAPGRPLSAIHADLADARSRHEAERVETWRQVYDGAYEDAAATAFFDTRCWRSSYTGERIPDAEMEEWLGHTVESVLALQPRRVLEIGCGTGLVLSRVGPHCELYLATDLSGRAVDHVRRHLPALGTAAAAITLRCQPADDFTGIAPGSFETAILNSVIQYFPSLDYLERVLEGVIARIAPGGRIFLGDVRDTGLVEAFHLSVLLEQAAASGDDLPATQLRERWRARLSGDDELAVGRDVVERLVERFPSIGETRFTLKRGRAANELTRFRYDVVLRIGQADPQTTAAMPRWHWDDETLSLGALGERLMQADLDRLTLVSIPNRRVAAALAAARDLAAGDDASALALRQATDAKAAAAIDPDDLRRLAEAMGYEVELRPAAQGEPGCFDALLTRPANPCVHHWIAAQSRRRAETIAVSCGDRNLTYQALESWAGQLAATLRARGVRPGDRVGLCVERSVALPVALLGILKTGACYVPLDPAYPRDRLAFMVADSALSLVVTQSSLGGSDPWPGVKTVDVQALPAPDRQSTAPTIGHADDIAYILYTSGSTGRPKGVEVTHRSLGNLLRSMQREPGFTPDDRLLALTTISFDIAGLELFLPLIAGGRVEIATEAAARDGLLLRRLVDESDATVIQATPATWQMLLAAEWGGKSGLKILCGGEALSRALADRLQARCAELWNLYGPTETTIWSTLDRVMPGQPITIGRPIANTCCHVVDDALQPMREGETGELLIGGDGVARGYLNRPDLNAACFIPDHLEPGAGARLYRTGDCVRRLPDGKLHYAGRRDAQIKLDGHRIELGDVEAGLLQVDGIRGAVAVLRRDGDWPHLVAFVVPARDSVTDLGAMLAAAAKNLPGYMVPAALHALPAFPLTPGGKVDRTLLREAPLDTLAAAPSGGDHDEELRRLCDAVAAQAAPLVNLAPGAIEPDANLGQYGFNSVRFTALCLRLNKAFGSTLTPTLFYRHTNIRAIARQVRAGRPRPSRPVPLPAAPSPPPVPAERETDAIAIIGIGGRLPGFASLEAFWDGLLRGADPIVPLPPERRDETWRRVYGDAPVRAAFLDGVDAFDAAFFGISRREAEWMDPRQRLLLEVVWETLEQAGQAPEGLAGSATGVFVGAAGCDYWELQRDRRAAIDPFTLGGFSGSILANRLSFWFDLRGPSATIDTACSSSAVALHRAVQAIRRGECDRAIAAGVNVIASPYFHRSLEAGGYLSPDARCKSFDARADGYVRGEGVGAVLLRPLTRARADGDMVHAVILASAENHGGRANALSAPNREAQAALIVAAYRAAGIDPATVSYIETHGTGTRLGDPIEIDALKDAFETLRGDAPPPQAAHCGLGALKSAIGHLEAAAGIAGLLKLVLAFKHRTLPGLPSFERQNPYVELEGGPFHLVTRPAEWPRPTGAEGDVLPRRAGLSSFGFGGANVHVVLEEAPDTGTPDTPPVGPSVAVLSARSEAALRRQADALAQHLAGSPDGDLADILFTLQAGRAALDWRLAMPVSGRVALIDHLAAFAAGAAVPGCHHAQARAHKAVFDLVADSAEGRDLLAAIVRRGDLDRAARLWVLGAAIDWAALWTGRPRRLPLPTYPFERERYWLPDDDSVVAVPPPLQQVRQGDAPLVTTRLTGSEAHLRDHVVAGTVILPAVALIEMARAAGEQAAGRPVQALRNLVWMRPVRLSGEPLDLSTRISLDDGAFAITGAEDAGGTVVHAQGRLVFLADRTASPLDLDAIMQRCRPGADASVLYEQLWRYGLHLGAAYRPIQALWTGDGEALALLRLPASSGDPSAFHLHPSLMDGALQTALCGLWNVGEQPLHVPFSMAEVTVQGALPATCYAYATRAAGPAPKFDVTITDESGRTLVAIREFLPRPAELPGAKPAFCFREEWQPAIEPETGEAPSGPMLVVGFDPAWSDAFARLAPAVSPMPPNADAPAWRAALADLRQGGAFPALILYRAPPIDATATDHPWAGQAIALLQALGSERARGADTAFFYLIPKDDTLEAARHRAVSGLLRTMQREQPRWTCKTIELNAVALADPAQVLAAARAEWRAGPDAVEIRHRGAERQIRRFVPWQPAAASPPAARADGVYWITGGLGGLGRLLARHLARQPGIRLVLTGRRTDQGAAFADELRALGAEVLLASADLGRREDVARAIAAIRARFGAITGLFHAAGAIRDSTLVNKDLADLPAVLGPKITGTCLLDELLCAEPLDVFVLFSSIAGTLGNAGQGDYALANRFLDEFAGWREARRQAGRRHGQTLSIAWPLWRAGGMRPDAAGEQMLARSFGLVPLDSRTGLALLEDGLAAGLSRFAVMAGDGERIRRAVGLTQAVASAPVRPAADAPALRDFIEQRLVALAAGILKRDPAGIDPGRDMAQYGFESLAFTEFANAINANFGLDLTPALFFEHPTLASFVTHLSKEHGAAFVPAMPAAPSPVPPPQPIPPVLPVQAHVASEEPVAIVGLSCVMPGGPDARSFWDNLAAGRDLVGEVPADRWDWRAQFGDPQDTDRGNTRWGAFIDGVDRFDARFFGISPREAALMDPQQRLFLQTAWGAIEDAGIKPSDLAGSRTGVFVGVATRDYAELMQQRGIAIEAHTPTGNAPSLLANRLSFLLDLTGPSEPIDTACSSSLVAIQRAVETIRAGSCSMAIAGGVNLMLTPGFHIAFSKAGMLSPDGRCKTFDTRADGYVRGEGVGAILLKPLSRALADGDPIHALVRNAVVGHGGHANSLTAPNPQAQAGLLVAAYAGIDPGSVTHIEAHGTGTALGDPIEVTGLKRAFATLWERAGRTPPTRAYCGLGSVKSNIGHLEAAAGIAGLIKTVLAMRHATLPASLHVDTLNPYIDLTGTPFEIVREGRPWERLRAANGREVPRRAGVSSFGFGGANAHVVLEEAPAPAPRERPPDRAWPFVLSARSESALRDQAGALARFLDTTDAAALALDDIALTLLTGREAMTHRLAIVASDRVSLRERLQRFADGAGPGQDGFVGQDVKPNGPTIAADATEAASAWVGGAAIDPRPLLAAAARRVNLPTYPFARTRHWIEDAVPLPVAAAEPEPEPDALAIFRRDQAALEALCPLLLLRALQGMGAFPHPSWQGREDALIRDLRIHPDHHRLWEALLDMLAQAGLLRRSGGMATVTEALGTAQEDLASLEKQLNRLRPMAMHVNLLRVCLDAYPALLRGEIAATDVLFPDASMRRVEMIYRGHAEADHANGLVAAAVTAHCRAAGSAPRILEIGAGTGGTTTAILASLIPFTERLRYTYTDISASFTEHGRARLAELYPFVEFRTLDIERDPRGQGFEPGSYDVVIAANVAHATRSIAKTLAHAKTLLKPGGRLVLNELVRRLNFTTLTFGLLKGWWLFEDGQARIAHSPLLTAQGWHAALTAAGFRRIEPGGTEGLAQAVLVCESDGVIAAPAPARPAPAVVPDALLEPGGSSQDSSTRALLTTIVAQALKLPADEIGAEEPFAELGLDSILVHRLNRDLAEQFGLLPKSVLLEHASIAKLTRHLTERHGDRLEARFGSAPAGIAPLLPHAPQATPDRTPAAIDPAAPPLPVAVIGMAGRFPGAADLDQFWENLQAGRRSIGEIPPERWDGEAAFDPDPSHPGAVYSKWGGFLRDVDKFDPLFFGIAPRDAKGMNPEERLMLETVWAALEDAGYTPLALAGLRVGVFVAANSLAYSLIGGTVDSTGYHLSNRVSYVCNFSGPSLTIDTACSSSVSAVHLACRSLQQGECDLAVAGGVNLYLHPGQYRRLCALKLLSSRPCPAIFDRDGDGFTPGEGVGAVLLRPLDEAVAARDHVHGLIRASGIGHKGRNEDYALPSPASQQAALRQVLRSAWIDPNTITLVEAQALGSALVDSVEWAALNGIFGKADAAAGFCAYGSVKPNIGHLETAAGMAQVMKVLLQMRHGQLVPCLFAEEMDPAIVWDGSPFYPVTSLRPWAAEAPRRAVISSFGGGGAQAHLVIEQHAAAPRTEPEDEPRLVVLSARSEDRLRAVAEQLLDLLDDPARSAAVTLADMAFTLQRGRVAFAARLAVLADDKVDLRTALAAYLGGMPSDARNPVEARVPSPAREREPVAFPEIPSVTRSMIHPGLWHGVVDRHAAKTDRDAIPADLEAAGPLWVAGAEIDWSRLDPQPSGRRVPLPSYPFEARSCWLGDDTVADTAGSVVADYYDRLFASTDGAPASKGERHLTFAPLIERPPGFSWLLAFNEPHRHPAHTALLRDKQREAKAVLYRNVDFSTVHQVLDIGCGLGADLIELARAWPHLQGQGYTLAPRQAAAARDRIGRAGLDDRLRITCADSTLAAHATPYDLIIGFEVLPHIRDKRAAFANMARHLRPGGCVLLADCVASTVTEIDLPHLAMFTSTQAQYAALLAEAGLRLSDCVDASTEIANFLDDPDFEANLARLSRLRPDAEGFAQEHRCWSSFGQGIRRGLFRYVLLTLRPADPGTPRTRLIERNEAAFREARPYAACIPDDTLPLADRLDEMDEAELDRVLDRLLAS